MDFAAAGVRPQGEVAQAPIHEWLLPDGAPWTRFYSTGSGYLLRFPGLADFEVSDDGATVRSWAVPGIPDESIRHLYINQVLPLALSKRGRLVFHGSAVDVGDGAVAFVGASGRGKSTLAASFAANGSRFLTDDGLVVEFEAGEPRVAPSHPSLRLWDDSREAVIGAAARAAPAVHFTTKGRFLAGDAMVFCDDPRALRRIYFLGEGAARAPSIAALGAAEGLIELVKHSFLLDIGERDLLASHFDRLSSLAGRPICFRLDYPRRFEALAEVRAAILEHAAIPAR